MNYQGILHDTTGNIRFTKSAYIDYRNYFRFSGIDIRQIKTERQFIEARMSSSPFFETWILERIDKWPSNNKEYQLIRDVLLKK